MDLSSFLRKKEKEEGKGRECSYSNSTMNLQQIFSFVSQSEYIPNTKDLYIPQSWRDEKDKIDKIWYHIKGVMIDGMKGEGKTSFLNYLLEDIKQQDGKYIIEDITLSNIQDILSRNYKRSNGERRWYVIDDMDEFQSTNGSKSIEALKHVIENSSPYTKYFLVGSYEFSDGPLLYHITMGDILKEKDREEILRKILERYNIEEVDREGLEMLRRIRSFKFLEKELIELVKKDKKQVNKAYAKQLLTRYYKNYFGNSNISVYFPTEIEDKVVKTSYFDVSLKYITAIIKDKKGAFFLLYGEHGTGKTTLSRLVAKELNIPILIIKGSELEDKYVGETVRRLKEIFRYASSLAKDFGNAIVLFDEITGLLSERSWYKEDQVEYFLSSSEELKESGCIVMGTTNKPWEMGRVLSRFDSRLYVPLPTDALDDIVKHYAEKEGIEEKEMHNIIKYLEKDKLSIRDIKRIAQLMSIANKMGTSLNMEKIANFTYENNLLPVEWEKVRKEIGDDLSLLY